MKNIMYFLMTLFLMSFSISVLAGTQASDNNALFDLNRAAPGALQKHQVGTLLVSHQVRILKAKYDFAVQGGAQVTGNLVGENGKPVIVPKGAVIVNCLIDVLTTGAAGGTGTMSLTAQGAGDLKGTTAAASYTGRVACVPVGTAATAIKMTADRTLTYTIATANWTQGKFWVYIYYITGGT